MLVAKATLYAETLRMNPINLHKTLHVCPDELSEQTQMMYIVE